MREIKVAMIGEGFMGRTHSNAWSQVTKFFKPPVLPVMHTSFGQKEENPEAFCKHWGWQHASVEVHGERRDTPPRMTAITYRLTITTDEAPHRVELLHRNLTKFGTIYNTLAAVCEVTGDVVTTPTAR